MSPLKFKRSPAYSFGATQQHLHSINFLVLGQNKEDNETKRIGVIVTSHAKYLDALLKDTHLTASKNLLHLSA